MAYVIIFPQVINDMRYALYATRQNMKKAIHPKYNTSAKVKCACGNEFTVGSTVDLLKIELCHLCHPFYTGKQKLVDSARRVEKFKEKVAKQATTAETRKGKKVKRENEAKKKADK